MKSKIVVAIIVLIIILPVSYVGIRELRHRRAAKHMRKVVIPPEPYAFNVTTHDPSLRGYLLMAPYPQYAWKHGRLVIIDMAGNKYLDKYVPGAIYDFRQWRINGKTYYTYMTDDLLVPHIRNISLKTGHAVLLDSSLREIKQIHLIPHGNIVRNRNQDLDLHDIVMFSEDHFITVAAYEKNVHNIPDSLHPSPYIKVVAPIIQEVVKDSVIWQWDGSGYPEFYGTSNLNNHFADTSKTQDYMHINSLCLDPNDGNVIVSFRSMDQVVKINSHTGKIMWRLGGKNSDFPMNPNQQFLRMHSAILTDNGKTLLLLDNGDSILRQTSRVLEFNLDEQQKKITSFKAMSIPENYAQFMGSVEKYGDNYLIGGGSANYVLQINSQTIEKKFELAGNQLSYRVYKVDSIYGLEKQRVK